MAILNLLDRTGVSRLVIKSNPEILYINDTKEIEKIISTLKTNGIKKESISKIPNILTKKDIKDNIDIIKYIQSEKETFGDVLEHNSKIITDGDLNNIKEFAENIKNRNISKDILSIYPDILIRNKTVNVLEIINNLNKIGEADYYLNNPTILSIQEPQKILDIADFFDKYKLPKSIYKKSVSIFTEGDVDNMKSVVEELDSKGIDRDILQNSFILARGNAKNITRIIDKFDDADNTQLGADLLKRSGTILAQGDAEKIDDITSFLVEKGYVKEGINIPATIYAKGNPEQMEKIYQYIEKIGLLPSLVNSLTLLIRPLDNIKANLNILIENRTFW